MKNTSAVIFIGILIASLLLIGYVLGRNKIMEEAIERGYATYDNDNGKSSIGHFKWKEPKQYKEQNHQTNNSNSIRI